MHSFLQLSFKYLGHLFRSSSQKGHGVHSPFVFSFIRDVLNDDVHYDAYDKVEAIRKEMLRDHSVIPVMDMGAGQKGKNKNLRSVSSIARRAVKPRKWGQLLFRMAQYYAPSTILELGTSLGVTTSYLALGNEKARVITLEGSSSIMSMASKNFQRAGINNIEVVEGDFNSVLSVVLSGSGSVDLAFVDGNHRKEATERYFHQLLEKASNNSIFIFDDIHWSPEMEQAWENIRTHEAVRCSIDLFQVGIILFRKEFINKQHFVIRF